MAGQLQAVANKINNYWEARAPRAGLSAPIHVREGVCAAAPALAGALQLPLLCAQTGGDQRRAAGCQSLDRAAKPQAQVHCSQAKGVQEKSRAFRTR